MEYTLRYEPRVNDEDRKRIAPAVWSRIGRAIDQRLTTAPDRFGQPLSGALRGFRKLRVGDHRVIFEVVGAEVRILAIMHRRHVYERATRRLGR